MILFIQTEVECLIRKASGHASFLRTKRLKYLF